MKLTTALIGSALVLSLYNCKGDDSSSSDSPQTFADFEFEREYGPIKNKVKKSTTFDKDGDESSKSDYTYNDAGKLTKQIDSNVTAALVDYTFSSGAVHEYDANNMLAKTTTYSDEDLKVKSLDIVYTYKDGVLSKVVDTDYDTDGNATNVDTTEYDEFGREKTITEVNNVGQGNEQKTVTTWEYAGNEMFSKKTSTEKVDGVKTKVNVFDFPNKKVTKTTFSDENDTKGTVIYTATLVDGYDVFNGYDRVIAKTSTEKDNGNTITTTCTVKNGDKYPESTCVAKTVSDTTEKTTKVETTVTYLNQRSFTYGKISFGLYYPWNKSITTDTMTNDEVSQRVIYTMEYNDRWNHSKTTEDTKTGTKEANLKSQTVDVTSYTYDQDGLRLLKQETKRTTGTGTGDGASKYTYEY